MIQIPTFFLFDTGAGPNLISKSIVSLSRRGLIQYWNVRLLRSAKKKPLKLEGVMLLHEHVGDLDVPVWFGVVNELAVIILVGTSFVNGYVRGIFFSEERITLKNSRPVCIRAMRRKNEKSTNSVVTNDVWPVTGNQNREEICVAGQTVILPRSELSALHMSIMVGLRPTASKPLAQEREQVTVTRGIANILPLVPLYVLVTIFFMKPVHVQKRMVVVRGMVSPMLRERLGKPSEPKNDKCEASAVYELSQKQTMTDAAS